MSVFPEDAIRRRPPSGSAEHGILREHAQCRERRKSGPRGQNVAAPERPTMPVRACDNGELGEGNLLTADSVDVRRPR